MALDIPDGLYDLYHEGIDTVIEFNGKPCTLIYPPLQTECPNCLWNEIGQTSAGVYKSGGPITFSFGPCPYCHGRGVIETEVTESIDLIVHWDIQSWILVNKNVAIPAGAIQTFGYMRDYSKIANSRHLIVADINSYATFKFERYGDMTPHGFKHRYLICTWQKA